MSLVRCKGKTLEHTKNPQRAGDFSRVDIESLAGARHRLITLLKVSARFAGGRYILRARALKDLFCFLGPFRTIAMYRKQNASTLYAPLISLCFVLGDTHPNEGAGDSTDRAANSYTG